MDEIVTHQVCALGSLSGVPYCSTVKDCGPLEPEGKMSFCGLMYFTHKALDIAKIHPSNMQNVHT